MRYNTRPRIPSAAARAIEDVRRARALETFQAAHAVVLDAGLRSLGGLPSLPAPTETRCNDAVITVPLPREARSIIKEMAKREYRSNRSMTRVALFAGLKALGAWPPNSDQ